MKSVSRPGRWIGGLMMHQVYIVKDLFMMHDSVKPIEISIVHEQHDREGRKIIDPSVFRNVRVHGCVWPDARMCKYNGRNQCKNDHRSNRIENFSRIIFILGKALLNFFVQPFISKNNIEKNECDKR